MRGYQVTIGVPGDSIRTAAGPDRGTVARHRRGDGLGRIGVGHLGITTPWAAIATHPLLITATTLVGRRGIVQRALLRRRVLIGVGRGTGPPVVLVGCHVGRVSRTVGEQHDDPHGDVRLSIAHQFGRRLAQPPTDVGVGPAKIGHLPLGIHTGQLRPDVDAQWWKAGVDVVDDIGHFGERTRERDDLAARRVDRDRVGIGRPVGRRRRARVLRWGLHWRFVEVIDSHTVHAVAHDAHEVGRSIAHLLEGTAPLLRRAGPEALGETVVRLAMGCARITSPRAGVRVFIYIAIAVCVHAVGHGFGRIEQQHQVDQRGLRFGLSGESDVVKAKEREENQVHVEPGLHAHPLARGSGTEISRVGLILPTSIVEYSSARRADGTPINLDVVQAGGKLDLHRLRSSSVDRFKATTLAILACGSQGPGVHRPAQVGIVDVQKRGVGHKPYQGQERDETAGHDDQRLPFLVSTPVSTEEPVAHGQLHLQTSAHFGSAAGRGKMV